MKHLIFFVFYLALFVACNSQNQQVINLKPTEFIAALEDHGGIILDVRTPQEVKSGRLDQASKIDFYDINFDKKLAKIQKRKPIFVYCKSGGRSTKVAAKLVHLGHHKVYNLIGGLMAWRRAGYSLVGGGSVEDIKTAPTSVEELMRLIQNNNHLLVDFHTKWCVPCRKLSPIIDQLEELLSPDLTVVRVDIDISEDCAKQWEIEAVPTLIHFRNGRDVWRHTGLISKEEIISHIQ